MVIDFSSVNISIVFGNLVAFVFELDGSVAITFEYVPILRFSYSSLSDNQALVNLWSVFSPISLVTSQINPTACYMQYSSRLLRYFHCAESSCHI